MKNIMYHILVFLVIKHREYLMFLWFFVWNTMCLLEMILPVRNFVLMRIFLSIYNRICVTL
jgi:hypothetical protein